MYSVNGVPLRNPEFGWRIDKESVFVSDYVARSVSLITPGRAGVWTLPPQPMDATNNKIVIRTPKATRRRLRALLMQPSILLTPDANPTVGIQLEYLSVASEMWLPAERVMKLSFLLRANDVYWRDLIEATSTPVALGASTTVPVMHGLSAPVTDAIVRIKGGTTGLVVRDSQGSFFSYAAALPSGSYLRYESADGGAAFITTTDTWTGGTPVIVDSGPDPFTLNYKYGITLAAELNITTTARTGSPTVEVRGRRAHTS